MRGLAAARVGTVLVALVLLATACGTAVADGVPEIIEGRSVCDECGMVIDDIRLAAAWRLPDGSPRVFDDIGGMLVHGDEMGDTGPVGKWVFDHGTGDAVPASSALFVAGGEVSTPMAWGVVAYAVEADADSLAASAGGRVVDWEGLVAAFRAGGLGVHDHEHLGGQQHGHEGEAEHGTEHGTDHAEGKATP